jgi:hypothetical protein
MLKECSNVQMPETAVLAWPQHVVCIVALAIGVAVRIEARVEGLVEAPIAAKT